jgi:hypothetical protein
MRTMQLVVEAACIADGMAGFISPPQRSDGGAAILTCYQE